MECWGASGGGQNSSSIYGFGGYVCGTITTSATSFYVFVGEHPTNGSMSATYNGGGAGQQGSQTGYAGGGSTDIRTYVNSVKEWNNSTSISSRIIVAAGGGGSGLTGGKGGQAGGLIGYNGLDIEDNSWYPSCFCGLGGTQTSGGNFCILNDYIKTTQYLSEVTTIRNSYVNQGGLGYGGHDNSSSVYSVNCGGPGGGSGYYGGGAGNRGHSGGGGGSSFISGHPGCASITGYVFTTGTTKMIDGKGLTWTTSSQTTGGTAERMPTTSGGQEALNTGHSGDGYAKITSL